VEALTTTTRLGAGAKKLNGQVIEAATKVANETPSLFGNDSSGK
jgi:hypothetical protein